MNDTALFRRVRRRLGYLVRLSWWRLALGRRLEVQGLVLLGRRLTLKPRGNGRIALGRRVELEYDVNMESWGLLRIGANTFVGHGTTIGCNRLVTIGANCLIGEYVSIRDNDHRFERSDRPIREQGQSVAPVAIGDNVWIGAKVTVLAGVQIGAGSVIGANAVVTHDIPAGVVAAGVPARVIKKRDEA